MDIRWQRTQDMLLSAFDDLVHEKQLENITVTELCELSTVRRATFYRHFSDMNAFVRFYFSSLTDRFIGELKDDRNLDDLIPYARAMHEKLLQYTDENKALFRHIMGSDMLADTIDMAIIQVADGIIARIHSDMARGELRADIQPEAVGLYYAAGLVHALRWRVMDEVPMSIDEAVDSGTAILRAILAPRVNA